MKFIADIYICLWPLQGTSVNIIVGNHVWLEDPELVWIDGQVNKIKGQEAEIRTSNGKTVRLEYARWCSPFFLHF